MTDHTTIRSTDAADREFIPPVGGAVPLPDYAPGETTAQQARARERSGFDLRNSPGTYLLVGVNIAVFLWMVTHGVSTSSPSSDQLMRYGAQSMVSVIYAHQWWRLLTATFVHIGIIHIASNMWCLWNLGLLGEPLLGLWGLLAVYGITGVAGNLLSTLHSRWIGVDIIGAGASGAVFGLAGILIVLLSNRRLPIPWNELQRLRRSVIQFAVLNLVLGVAGTASGIVPIDNWAHVGGFASGLALGPLLVPRMTAGRDRYLRRQKQAFALATFVLVLVAWGIAHIR